VQAFSSAPRPMVAMLATVVAALTLQVVLFSPSIVGLIFPALIGAVSLSALFGSFRAARSLKWLLYALSALPVLMVLAGNVSASGITRGVVVGALTFATARYLGTSKAVAAFYGQSPEPPTLQAN
jgi:hypothetical protein